MFHNFDVINKSSLFKSNYNLQSMIKINKSNIYILNDDSAFLIPIPTSLSLLYIGAQS